MLQGNRMNTVWDVECESHRPYRAGNQLLSPGGAALLLHPNTQRPRAGGPGPGAIFDPSLWDERLHLAGRLRRLQK